MLYEIYKLGDKKQKDNIYHYSQVDFPYNSNKIEGSRLTSEQTEAIFDTSSFISKSDDLIKLEIISNYLTICQIILINY